jgi:hypothetical protein
VLKFIFWSLLCINGILLAYGQGYLGNFKGNEREPARARNQVNADKLTLVSASAASTAAAKAAAALAPPPPAPPEPVVARVACMEVGPFSTTDGKRFETLLRPLELGKHLSRDAAAAQEATSHIVYIPSLGSKEAADKKAAELKGMGVENYFVMNDNTPMKWAISLGVFKSENAAKTLLAALEKQGVTSARITGRGATTARLNYQIRDIEPATKDKIEKIAERFLQQDSRSCK